MLRKMKKHPKFENFLLPFDGKLNGSNRWVKLAEMIPWDELENIYGKSMSEDFGRPGINARVAIGTLLIKHKLKFTDEETIEQLSENPYLQFFLGYEEFRQEKLFDPTMLVHFRKRLNFAAANEMNEVLTKLLTVRKPEKAEQSSGNNNNDDNDQSSGGNSGKLLIDATVAPADIKYPTDLDLLNEAREKSEKLIDKLHDSESGKKKPRTYREIARKEYLSIAKRKNKAAKMIRKAMKKQAGFLKRNLNHIKQLLRQGNELNEKDSALVEILRKVQFQQSEMLKNGKRSVENRIVSISQPHVRPIVRGKAGAKTEFGAKISVSVVDGLVYLAKLSWDAYNEGQDMISQVEKYKEKFGHYPESVHADKIYANRENRRYLAQKNIRLSAPPLGRPRKDTPEKVKQQQRLDEIDRIPVEGKFGNAKRKYSLDRIYAKLKETGETWIVLIIIVMNLDKLSRILSRLIFKLSFIMKVTMILEYKTCKP